MVDRDKILKLFEKEKFREHSIYFYQESRSVSEVEKLSGIPKQTIYEHLSKFKKNKYYDSDFVEGKGLGAGKILYRFAHKLPAVWISEEANLTSEQEEALLRFLESPEINTIARAWESWYDVRSVVVYSAIFGLLSSSVEKIGEILNKPMMGTLDIATERLSAMKLFEKFSEKELMDFVMALQGFSQKKRYVKLFERIQNSGMVIAAPSQDWAYLLSESVSLQAGLVAKYYKNLKANERRIALAIQRSKKTDIFGEILEETITEQGES